MLIGLLWACSAAWSQSTPAPKPNTGSQQQTGTEAQSARTATPEPRSSPDAPAAAGATPELSVDEVIARYFAARGGLDKLRAIQTKRTLGHITLPAGGRAELVTENKRPNLMRQDFTLMGMTATRAFDGLTGWHFMPFQGEKSPRPVDAVELADVRRDADLDGPLADYKRRGFQVDFGDSNCSFSGKSCYDLKVTYPEGSVEHYFIDRESYLEIGLRKLAADGSQVEGALSDYREVGGLLFPFHSEIRTLGKQGIQLYVVDHVELNVPIDDGRFKMPEVLPDAPSSQAPSVQK